MKRLGVLCLAGALGLVLAGAAHGGVTRIVIDEVRPFSEPAGSPAPAIAYEQVAGRAFGELDPKLPANAIIQDISWPKAVTHSITRGHRNQICNYLGGMIPFARTAAERQAARDPRPSLEERYGSHAGYVAAVRKAAARAVAEGFLLPEDAAELVSLAEASHVLR
jgi:Alpha/beta hydrolase domain